MFAVIILGVGFIMVAAIFPVAIQQAKSTSEETTAAAIARGAATYIGGVLTDGTGPGITNCPAAAKQVSTGSGSIQVATVQQPGLTVSGTIPALWDSVRGNLILPEDPRYAAVFLYRRNLEPDNSPSPYVQLYVFPVQSRVTPIFDSNDVNLTGTNTAKRNLTAWPPPGPPPSLTANVVDSSDSSNTAQVDKITFSTAQKSEEAAAEGAYVVVADSAAMTAAVADHIGDVYKLGARRLDLDPSGLTWELQAGSDFTPAPTRLDNVNVFIIGRTNTNPNPNQPPTFDGPAMPISYYTTFVKVN